MVLIDKKKFDYKLSLGESMPSFSLIGTDNEMHPDNEFAKDVLCVWFSCNHCPYIHGSEEALQALVAEMKDSVDFVAINSNEDKNYPDDSFENMQKKDVNYTYLHDPTQEVAKAFGGECTPHFFVFQNRKLVYQGRLDDAGQDASSATTHELKDALAELVAGKDVSVPLTSAMGCSIKWN